MPIFVFSSRNLTNIWAGIGATLWAVSKSKDPSTHQGRLTKAKNMQIGSLGILYCSETQSLTTPFVVLSNPDPKALVKNIWPEEWVLPFKIHSLGTPTKQLSKDEAMSTLPTLRGSQHTNFSHALPVQATTVFSPSPLKDIDWEILIKRLADGAMNA
jgi:hypothetical protein